MEALAAKRIVVAIDGWARGSSYPDGHYVRTLGDANDRDTETEVLLQEHDVVCRPFGQAALSCLPTIPWKITEADMKNRVDMRHIGVFSVDPPGCTDIDDALHCLPLDNGNVQIGVHIADVTHFVTANTALDAEAMERGTSVYLVEKRIDMLPGVLGTDLCSLHCHVDRLAFSVLWEIDAVTAEVVDVQYTKSVIASRAAMTYQEAQARIDNVADVTDPMTIALRGLMKYGKILRARRVSAGGLTLASPEVKFKMDENRENPIDIGLYELRDTNAMVEEYMLLANIWTAKKCLEAYPRCAMLRRHPPPLEKKFGSLVQMAGSYGLEIKTATSKELGDSLDAATMEGDPYFNKLMRILATRCMQQAEYFSSGTLAPSEYNHYGLSIPIYTHFTSPIRRYADVLVHRLLAASLGLEQLPDKLMDPQAMRKVAQGINHRHRMAQFAGRSSTELHALIYFKDKGTVVAEGRVTKLRHNGFMVLIPQYGLESVVHLTPKAADGAAAKAEFTLSEDSLTLTCNSDAARSYRVLQTVTVSIRIEETTGFRRKLCLRIATPEEIEEADAKTANPPDAKRKKA